jgi:hypothetical protein
MLSSRLISSFGSSCLSEDAKSNFELAKRVLPEYVRCVGSGDETTAHFHEQTPSYLAAGILASRAQETPMTG